MGNLAGTWRLVRLAVRRDRLKLTLSVLGVGLLIPMIVAGVGDVFASEEDMRRGIAFLAANPAMRLFGLPTGADFGNLLMLRAFTMIAIIVALINTFAIIRHTRQNEEFGRTELLGSHVLGRHAPLASALIVTTLVNILITAFAYLGLLTADITSSGAFAMALAIGLVGFSFSGFAALAAQLTQSSRGANGLASTSIIVGFMLSGVGSLLGAIQPGGFAVDPAWPIWLSPFGWSQLLEPFAAQNWAVVFLPIVFFGFCVAFATMLANRRDVGSSIFPAKQGRRAARPSLLSMTGLSWRLQKNSFVSWLIGIGLLGVIYGFVAPDVEELLAQAEGIAEIFIGATGSTEIMLAFFGSITGILGLFVLIYGVSAILRMRAEEERALEFLLATQTSRLRWAITGVAFVFGSVFLLATAAGLATGITAHILLDGFEDIIQQVVIGVILQVPAIILVISAVVFIFGAMPKRTNVVAWLAVFIAVLLGPLFHSLLNLPDVFANASPFSHTPAVPPIDDIAALPIVMMLGLSMILLLAGFIFFSRRDIDAK